MTPAPAADEPSGPPGTANQSLITRRDPSEASCADPRGSAKIVVHAGGQDTGAGRQDIDVVEGDVRSPDDLGHSQGLWRWFEQGHWLGKWRTPLMVRLWRYGAGSILAFVTSGVALFVCIQWLGIGAIVSAVIAFVAGALPNWVLNRRWAWEKRHREGMGHETLLYALVSLVSLGISVGVTKATAVGADHLQTHPIVRHLLVTGMYLLTTVALAGAKYFAYDRWVFADRRASSRAQVRKITEENRAP